MRRSFHAASLLLVVILFLSNTVAQIPVTSKDIRAEGVIVAFQGKSRHRVMPHIEGIATPVEFWIVRIDKWPYNAGRLAGERFARVTYRLYERNLTDCDINAKRLRFTLRENEYTHCSDSAGNSSEPELAQYELTTPGRDVQIPPLSKLPCLIADHAPVVLE